MSQKFTLQCHIGPELMQSRTHTTQAQAQSTVCSQSSHGFFHASYIYIKEKKPHIPVFVYRTVCGQTFESFDYKEVEA